MSYEIYLTPSLESSFSPETFSEYFSEIDNMSVQGTIAKYENEATGVYFLFELFHSDDQGYYVNFHMNFMRPSFFPIEAEPLVRAFAEAFNCSIKDDQIGGMDDGVYDRSRFLSGWYLTTERVCQSRAGDTAGIITYPQEQLIKNWKWNYNKESLQLALGENVFVPTIRYCECEGRVVSYVLWSDAVSVLMPKVDVIVIMRLHTLFDPNSADAMTPTFLCDWADLAPEIEQYPLLEEVEGYHLKYHEPPLSLVNRIKSLPNRPDPKSQIPYEAILDDAFFQKGPPPQDNTSDNSSLVTGSIESAASESSCASVALPQKGNGQSYMVILKDGVDGTFCRDSFSQKELGYHAPQWGNRCACCNDETTNSAFVYPQKREGVPPVEFDVPLCDRCAPNTGLDSKGFLILGNLAIVSLVLVFGYFFINPQIAVLVSGIGGLLASGVGALIRNYRIKYGRTLKLTIEVLSPKVIIKTPNRKLVERLEILNRPAVTEIL